MQINNKIIVVNALFIKNGGPQVILNRYIEELLNKGAKKLIIISAIELKIINKKISNISIKNFKKYNFLSIFYYLYYGVGARINNLNFDFIISFDYSLMIKNKNIKQYLYIHNAICLLNNKDLMEIINYDYKYIYYKYLYPIIAILFLKYKKTIIVQQKELAKFYEKKGMYVLIQPPSLIASKNKDSSPVLFDINKKKCKPVEYVYPTSCKAHKNIIMIIDAFNKCKHDNKILKLTIQNDGSKYYSEIIKAINGNKNIKLIGNMGHQELMFYMRNSRPIIIFPSLIESWGLPLEEARELNLKIIVINRNYAHETLNDYANAFYIKNSTDGWTSAFDIDES